MAGSSDRHIAHEFTGVYDRAEIERLRAEGWSYTRLGERFNVDGSSVRDTRGGSGRR